MNDPYVTEFLRPLQLCRNYRPTLGTSEGVEPDQFIELFSNDFFYDAIGLAIPEIYVAHKASGGITSFYRQLGIACENLMRFVLMRELGITPENVKWSYTLPTGSGRDRMLSLEARICPAEIADPLRRDIVQEWLLAAASTAGIEETIGRDLAGAVFEVRQG